MIERSIQRYFKQASALLCLGMCFLTFILMGSIWWLEHNNARHGKIERYKTRVTNAIEEQFWQHVSLAAVFSSQWEQHTDTIDGRLEQYDIAAIIEQNKNGEVSHSETTMSATFSQRLWGLFLPIAGKANTLSKDMGIAFVDGRVFMYATQPVFLNEQRTKIPSDKHKQSTITVFKEVTPSYLSRIGKQIGSEFNLHFNTAESRLNRSSYHNGYEAVLVSETEHSNGTEVLFDVLLYGGAKQPASFAIQIVADEYRLFDPRWLVLAILLIPVMCFSFWYLLRREILKPIDCISSRFDGPILDLEGKCQQCGDLPTELASIYHRLITVSQDLNEQHLFGQRLLDAIGDIIITLDDSRNIQYCNPAAVRWLGLDESLVIGQPFELFVGGYQEAAESSLLFPQPNLLGEINNTNQRTEFTQSLVVLTKRDQVFRCDVICQPNDVHSRAISKTIVVIRVLSCYQISTAESIRSDGLATLAVDKEVSRES
ncbi:PAS domain-containing protein [Vibrio tapetis subsp. quintayensis]|uniref:PAS domain-containing protein n=1 Tax=Vibrio tapetis TaxID=52443 RepID=UPI0025B5DC4C|nr:PAS domain-containing protein [Vibrio tapetis]MDN3681041.1 PAS domain-containing protein [Vibrio tapetis subsp. quintayensis]